MTRVFVWNSYGNVTVYAADTDEAVLAIVEMIQKAAKVYGDPILIPVGLSVPNLVKSVNYIIEGISDEPDNDLFDHGSGFTNISETKY